MPARAVFDRIWADELAAPARPSLTNPKSALQEWALGDGKQAKPKDQP